MAEVGPVMPITLVDLLTVPFVGSVVTCNSESTEIALACPASLAGAGEGICPYSPTITFGPSTYALTFTVDNPLVHAQSSISCIAVSSKPKFCTTVVRSIFFTTKTYEPDTYSDSLQAADLATADVTLTAGLEKLCSPLPGPNGTNVPATISGSTTTSGSATEAPAARTITVTSVVSATPGQISMKSSGSSSFVRNSSTNWFKYMLPVALMGTQIAALY